jgi:hypothetical protein
MITHTALQFQAMKKLMKGSKPDRALVKYHVIHQLATKPHPLTHNDVAQLEHFVHSNAKVLDNTIYHNNNIISPATTEVKYHKIPVKDG